MSNGCYDNDIYLIKELNDELIRRELIGRAECVRWKLMSINDCFDFCACEYDPPSNINVCGKFRMIIAKKNTIAIIFEGNSCSSLLPITVKFMLYPKISCDLSLISKLLSIQLSCRNTTINLVYFMQMNIYMPEMILPNSIDDITTP